jgi:hypothetical protein
MVREDKQIMAVNLFVDLLVSLVLHVVWVFGRHTVYDDLFVELHCKPILVDSNLFDVVSAPNLNSGFGYQMLDDYICHELSVSVSLLVQAMNLIHCDLMELKLSAVASCKNSSICRVD